MARHIIKEVPLQVIGRLFQELAISILTMDNSMEEHLSGSGRPEFKEELTYLKELPSTNTLEDIQGILFSLEEMVEDSDYFLEGFYHLIILYNSKLPETLQELMEGNF